MRHRTTFRFAFAFLALAFLTGDSWARVVEVESGQDYRPLLHELKPGDELVFLPGVHEQHATVNLKGTAEAPITVRGEIGADGERAEIRWTDRGQNTWSVSGEYLRIRDLTFHSTHHYGMRVGKGMHITIENCLFRDNGGGDLSANSGHVASLHILDSRFVGGKRTPIYIGSHDGGLLIEDFRFEGNVVDGSQIDHSGVVGYGIQLKLNVDGVIRNNYISGTQGPGVMVYGFEDPNTESQQIVENNILVGARHSANIVVGGGPATIRKNLVLGGRSGGIAVIDYNRRDLLDSVTVSDNIAAANDGRGLSIHQSARKLVAIGNRVYSATDELSIGSLTTSENVTDNETAPIERPLLEIVRQLQKIVPSSEAANAAIEALGSERLKTQQAILDLLRPLLEP